MTIYKIIIITLGLASINCSKKEEKMSKDEMEETFKDAKKMAADAPADTTAAKPAAAGKISKANLPPDFAKLGEATKGLKYESGNYESYYLAIEAKHGKPAYQDDRDAVWAKKSGTGCAYFKVMSLSEKSKANNMWSAPHLQVSNDPAIDSEMSNKFDWKRCIAYAQGTKP